MDLIDQFSNLWPVGEPETPSGRVALCNIPYSHLEFAEPVRTAFVAKKYHHPYINISPNDTEEDMYESETESEEDESSEEESESEEDEVEFDGDE